MEGGRQKEKEKGLAARTSPSPPLGEALGYSGGEADQHGSGSAEHAAGRMDMQAAGAKR